jgi:hypothetical protein
MNWNLQNCEPKQNFSLYKLDTLLLQYEKLTKTPGNRRGPMSKISR